MDNQQQPTKKLWSKIPADYKFEKSQAILIGYFKKQGRTPKDMTLMMFDDHILLFKKPKNTKPSSMLNLDFQTKFSIMRSQQQKVKSDESKLNDIIGLELSREGHDQVYRLGATQEQVKEWRVLLRQRINQLEFHSQFRVYKKIGKGSFATVYLAERIEDEMEVAVKAFSKSQAYAEQDGQQAIENEIKIMRKLKHDNIMKLYEVYESENSLYMCLELLEGGSLYDLIKSREILSLRQIQEIIYGVLQGLSYMHSKDIMHRDLKLENLVFRKQNQLETVMIADFGLATHVYEKKYLYCRCGTPGYVAPEVINNDDMSLTYSSICDIYSVGLIFYLLLTGKPAFNSKSYNEIVKLNRQAKIDFKSQKFESVPKNAVLLLKQMLQNDPEVRITARDCLDHSFFDQLKPKQELSEEQDLINKLARLNEDTIDMQRMNQIQNSPSQQLSPALNPTTKLKQANNIEPQNFMHMRSPVITARNSSISKNSPDTFKSPNSRPSPAIKPIQSKFAKSNVKDTPTNTCASLTKSTHPQNALLKYTLKKNTIQSVSEQIEEQKQK